MLPKVLDVLLPGIYSPEHVFPSLKWGQSELKIS